MNEVIIVAVITGGLSLIGTLSGSFLAQRKTTALVVYRLEKLEEKVNKHNNLVDRMYKAEASQDVTEKELRVANHRIDDLAKTKG